MFAIGIDAVEVDRFEDWHNYDSEQLEKVFTAQEIDYCLGNKVKSAERFAIRFAAKEAFYKAVSSLLKKPIPFAALCNKIEVIKDNSMGIPEICIHEPELKALLSKYQIKSTLTHTKTTAIALVYIF